MTGSSKQLNGTVCIRDIRITDKRRVSDYMPNDEFHDFLSPTALYEALHPRLWQLLVVARDIERGYDGVSGAWGCETNQGLIGCSFCLLIAGLPSVISSAFILLEGHSKGVQAVPNELISLMPIYSP